MNTVLTQQKFYHGNDNVPDIFAFWRKSLLENREKPTMQTRFRLETRTFCSTQNQIWL